MTKRATLRRLVKRLSSARKTLKRAGKGAQAFRFMIKADVVRQLMGAGAPHR